MIHRDNPQSQQHSKYDPNYNHQTENVPVKEAGWGVGGTLGNTCRGKIDTSVGMGFGTLYY